MPRPSAWSPITWVLTDGRTGHDHQALGVAEALGWPFAIKQIRYNVLARLPNRLLGRHRWGVARPAWPALAPPWPDLVISAGRRTVPVARWLRRHAADAFLVHLMWPGSVSDLDLVAVPEHDRVRDRPGLMHTLGTPSPVTPARLAAAAAALEPRLKHLPHPRIACLVGGSRHLRRFRPEDAEALARRLNRFAHAHHGSLLITTSRRTGRACEQALARAIEVPHLLDRFGSREVLYLGMLGSADAVVVTPDSASMCSEACTTGKPVFLDTANGASSGKLTRLHRRLEQLGYVRPLGAPWPSTVPPPLDPAGSVADAIKHLLPGEGTPR